MPQKKNPDISELVRGKTGRVYGSLITMLTVMKALPLAYNKDMQEDKECVFDAIDTVKMCLSVFAPMFDTLTVNRDKMLKAAQGGFINATDAADYLVRKGLAFRDAYTAVGKLVNYCVTNNKTLETLTIEEFKTISDAFEGDVYESLALKKCVDDRDVEGGPSEKSVKKQIMRLEEFLNEKGIH